MKIRTSPSVADKILHGHGVTSDEIHECFLNRDGPPFEDTRLGNRTDDPPTYWFIAFTDRERRLKIVYMDYPDRIQIKTAYPPNEREIALYNDLCLGLK